MNKKIEKLIGEILIDAGDISQQDLEQGMSVQSQVGGLIGTILVRLGVITEERLTEHLASQYGVMMLTERDIPSIETALEVDVEGPSNDWLAQYSTVFWLTDNTVHIASKNPLDTMVQQMVMLYFASQPSVKWYFATSRLIESLLNKKKHSEDLAQNLNFNGNLRQLAEEAPVIDKVNDIFSFAVHENASDIHIEPEQKECVVRFRVDGVLTEYDRFSLTLFDAISSRIKLISGMDIAEKRRPQDGRIASKIRSQEFDIRVSSAPSVNGESLVLRLLKKGNTVADLDNLGLSNTHKTQLKEWISQPYGMILVTGPTGSGKSTTLYGCLKEVADGKKKIITVEDPVEYKMSGITQIQANSDIGYDFAKALRAILRQDPDVLMIGEIRDLETARIAIQSALTGHLVFSTLHTNDAVSAFVRLIDMGVEPFLVASPMIGVQAQRLIRRLCDNCAEASPVPESLQQKVDTVCKTHSIAEPIWLSAKGCEQCNHTGYKGRMGIYEFITVDSVIREMIIANKSINEIKRYTSEMAASSMEADGLYKVVTGQTDYAEVLRILSQIDGI